MTRGILAREGASLRHCAPCNILFCPRRYAVHVEASSCDEGRVFLLQMMLCKPCLHTDPCCRRHRSPDSRSPHRYVALRSTPLHCISFLYCNLVLTSCAEIEIATGIAGIGIETLTETGTGMAGESAITIVIDGIEGTPAEGVITTATGGMATEGIGSEGIRNTMIGGSATITIAEGGGTSGAVIRIDEGTSRGNHPRHVVRTCSVCRLENGGEC